MSTREQDITAMVKAISHLEHLVAAVDLLLQHIHNREWAGADHADVTVRGVLHRALLDSRTDAEHIFTGLRLLARPLSKGGEMNERNGYCWNCYATERNGRAVVRLCSHHAALQQQLDAARGALDKILTVITKFEQEGHALNKLEDIRGICKAALAQMRG